MRYVAKENNFEYGKEVKMVTVGTPSDYKQYLDNNPNKTEFGLLFCTDTWVDTDTINGTTISIPCKPVEP